jgi:hypothetical protein
VKSRLLAGTAVEHGAGPNMSAEQTADITRGNQGKVLRDAGARAHMTEEEEGRWQV